MPSAAIRLCRYRFGGETSSKGPRSEQRSFTWIAESKQRNTCTLLTYLATTRDVMRAIIWKYGLSGCFFFLSSLRLIAQPAQQSPPADFLFPMRTVGVDHEEQVQWQPALRQWEQELEAMALSNPVAILEWLQNRKQPSSHPLTINIRNQIQGIKVGKRTTSNLNQPPSLVIQPLLCSIADQWVISLNLIDRTSQLLLGQSHQLLPRTAPKAKGSIMSQLWLELSQQSFKALDQSSALTLGLSLGLQTTRWDQGSTFCINQLLEGQLAQLGFKVTNSIGNETVATLQHLLPEATLPTRATRRTLIYWQWQDQKLHRQLPLTLTLRTTLATSVLGHVVGDDLTTEVTLHKNQQDQRPQIQWTIPPQILQLLNQEQTALAESPLPTVAKVYGAWAYLDKGRDWGLKINDRLVIQHPQQTITGHIVGFYGPEMQLQSPHGYPIHEGAILFIRKGQAKVALGQMANYDQTQYPTVWPPDNPK